MTSQPDKLFRDHLDQLRRKPGPEAWNRIETGLTHRRQKRIWWKAAAAILVLLSVSTLAWRHSVHPDAGMLVDDEKPVISVPPPGITEAKATPPIQQDRKQTWAEGNFNIIKSAPSNTHTTAAELQIPDTSSTPLVAAAPPSEAAPNETILPVTASAPTLENDPPTADPIVVHTASGKKIIYTADVMNSRFLKTNSVSLPDTNRYKPSSFLRVFDLSRDLKPETAYGELRQMKNDLFGLPFKGPSKSK